MKKPVGRPPVAEPMKIRHIRMTDAEWQKCKTLGGSSWVRTQIKTAQQKDNQ